MSGPLPPPPTPRHPPPTPPYPHAPPPVLLRRSRVLTSDITSVCSYLKTSCGPCQYCRWQVHRGPYWEDSVFHSRKGRKRQIDLWPLEAVPEPWTSDAFSSKIINFFFFWWLRSWEIYLYVKIMMYCTNHLFYPRTLLKAQVEHGVLVTTPCCHHVSSLPPATVTMQQVYLREKQNDSVRRRGSIPWRLAIRWTVNPGRRFPSLPPSFCLRLFYHLRIPEGPRNSVLCKTSCHVWKDKQAAHVWSPFCTHIKGPILCRRSLDRWQ